MILGVCLIMVADRKVEDCQGDARASVAESCHVTGDHRSQNSILKQRRRIRVRFVVARSEMHAGWGAGCTRQTSVLYKIHLHDDEIFNPLLRCPSDHILDGVDPCAYKYRRIRWRPHPDVVISSHLGQPPSRKPIEG